MDIEIQADAYEKATLSFLSTVAALTESDLDKQNGEGWTPRQIIHHVADSEAQGYARLRRAVAEPGSNMQAYEEGVWAANKTLGYEELPIAHSIAVIKAVRASSLGIIRRLNPGQLENFCIHEKRGKYTLESLLEVYTAHPSEHVEQMIKALA